jgi:serine/threonine-protein kinase
MAELYLARLQSVGGFEKFVAIKVILDHLSEDRQFRELFLNEGRITARLMHPNVCTVFDLGETDGQLYLAMEYLDGVSWEDLASALPDDPATVMRIVAGVLGQACDGLHYAHELRDMAGEPTPVVHRDVSPQNLLVTVDGVAKVLDFGVSKLLTDGKRTRTGVVKGKLSYMAPEQIRGEAVDRRADVFAAGAMAWEALTNERLFDRDTDFLIWKAVTEDPIPTVSSRQPAFGPDVDAVIMQAIARDREMRYPTIAAFAEDLQRVAGAFGGAASTREIAELVRARCAEQLATRSRQVAAAVQAAKQPAVEETPDDRDAAETASMKMRASSVSLGRDRRRRLPLFIALALAVIGATVAAVLIKSSTRREQPPAAMATVNDPRAAAAADAAVPDTVVEAIHEGSAQPVASKAPQVTRVTRSRSSAPAKNDPPPAVAPVEAPGTLSVSSDPYAVIYVDGVRIGDTTPLFKEVVAAGSHELRAVRSDGREQRIKIQVAPGKHVNLGTLTW